MLEKGRQYSYRRPFSNTIDNSSDEIKTYFHRAFHNNEHDILIRNERFFKAKLAPTRHPAQPTFEFRPQLRKNVKKETPIK